MQYEDAVHGAFKNRLHNQEEVCIHMKHTKLFLSCLVFSLFWGALGAVQARGSDQEQARLGVISGAYRPLAAILDEVSAQHEARVVDVESRQGARGELQYEITLITRRDGQKRELLVDAATGRVLAQEQDFSRQAASLSALAAWLRPLEQHDQRVVEAEFELSPQGLPAYQLQIAPAAQASQRMLLDARNGAVLERGNQSAAGVIRPMHEMLETLSPRFSGLVREVELEHDTRNQPFYELELLQPDGNTLELKVHAHTLEVLQRKIKRD